jgi:chromosome segregation ATPase
MANNQVVVAVQTETERMLLEKIALLEEMGRLQAEQIEKLESIGRIQDEKHEKLEKVCEKLEEVVRNKTKVIGHLEENNEIQERMIADRDGYIGHLTERIDQLERAEADLRVENTDLYARLERKRKDEEARRKECAEARRNNALHHFYVERSREHVRQMEWKNMEVDRLRQSLVEHKAIIEALTDTLDRQHPDVAAGAYRRLVDHYRKQVEVVWRLAENRAWACRYLEAFIEMLGKHFDNLYAKVTAGGAAAGPSTSSSSSQGNNAAA